MKPIAESGKAKVFPSWNGLKQGDAFSPWLLNFALEYAIRRVQINKNGLNSVVHFSFGFKLTILTYWEEAYILYRETNKVP
jgi:hypothetical protein